MLAQPFDAPARGGRRVHQVAPLPVQSCSPPAPSANGWPRVPLAYSPYANGNRGPPTAAKPIHPANLPHTIHSHAFAYGKPLDPYCPRGFAYSLLGGALGVEPRSKDYESPALAVELRARKVLRHSVASRRRGRKRGVGCCPSCRHRLFEGCRAWRFQRVEAAWRGRSARASGLRSGLGRWPGAGPTPTVWRGTAVEGVGQAAPPSEDVERLAV